MLKVIYALDASVTLLKHLPEEQLQSAPKSGYFKSLMFSTWFGAETKTTTKADRLKMGEQF